MHITHFLTGILGKNTVKVYRLSVKPTHAIILNADIIFCHPFIKLVPSLVISLTLQIISNETLEKGFSRFHLKILQSFIL